MRVPYYCYTYSTRILCVYAKRQVSWRKSVTFLKYYANMLMRLLRGRQTVYIYAIYRVYIEIMTPSSRRDMSCALQWQHAHSFIYKPIIIIVVIIIFVWTLAYYNATSGRELGQSRLQWPNIYRIISHEKCFLQWDVELAKDKYLRLFLKFRKYLYISCTICKEGVVMRRYQFLYSNEI